MTGFFVYQSRQGNSFMAYHCDCCNLNVIFGADEKHRTWCCGKWVERKEPDGLSAFFAAELPRVKQKAPPFRVLKYSEIENER
jgi:hypothetical protein